MFRKRERPGVRVSKKVGSITIHNMHMEKPFQVFDVKCDRSSPLGSPFYLDGDEARREGVCNSYSSWFNTKVLTHEEWPAYQELMRLRELYRKHGRLRIFCWCSPKRCHCQTIADWLRKEAKNEIT